MNRPVIVGTAGHIDHGKTALVAALTGKRTDRLKEELERGISIDIDFAPLRYGDQYVLGVVDVPGHERFVRNMVAGATGIDVALLVIDINEGIKPQTLEHIAIIELLGVTRGVVALTKADLADEAWLEFAQEVIQESLGDTVFSDAPIIVTSTKTGQGIVQLKEALRSVAENTRTKDPTGAFRLPVDKVYSVPGFGTVVSGTAWRGTVRVGDVLHLLPGNQPVRVRGIQVHGDSVQQAGAGQRCAVNVVGVERGEVRRGAVLAAPGTLQQTKLLDVHVQTLKSSERSLRHRDRVHIHLGTAETVGRVLLLEADELQPGNGAMAQLLLERPMVCETTDRFVLRNFSPTYTVGGGTVLEPSPERLHRRKQNKIIESLRQRTDTSPMQRLITLGNSGNVWTRTVVMQSLGVTAEEADEMLKGAAEAGHLVELPTGYYTKPLLEKWLLRIDSALRAEHQSRRLSESVSLTTLASRLGTALSHRDFHRFVETGLARGMWSRTSSGIRASGWHVELKPEEDAIYRVMEDRVRSAGVGGFALDQLVLHFPKRDRVVKSLLQYGREQGKLVELAPDLWTTEQALMQTARLLYNEYEKRGPLTLGQVRDLLGMSRKQALTLLEYFDRQGQTERVGDHRQVKNLWE